MSAHGDGPTPDAGPGRGPGAGPGAGPGTGAGAGEDRDARRAELVGSLGRVRARVSDACAAAGRSTSRVTLVVVTKTYPATDVALLASLGVRDVGEAREQELRDKHRELGGVPAGPGGTAGSGADGPGEGQVLRWHLIGRLQRNKARSVGRLADVVHSLDDPRLVGRLSEGAQEVGHEVGCFVQVSLDGDPDRGGVDEQQLHALADDVAAAASLRLLGVMAVAPVGAEPGEAFARLQAVSARLVDSHPGATAISAGMSGDLEQAVAHGATHLRVGAAILGSRPPLV